MSRLLASRLRSAQSDQCSEERIRHGYLISALSFTAGGRHNVGSPSTPRIIAFAIICFGRDDRVWGELNISTRPKDGLRGPLAACVMQAPAPCEEPQGAGHPKRGTPGSSATGNSAGCNQPRCKNIWRRESVSPPIVLVLQLSVLVQFSIRMGLMPMGTFESVMGMVSPSRVRYFWYFASTV
jgi:hypothetical protein